MWLMHKNKFLTKLKFQARGWEGDPTCQFCSEPEDTDHLLFQCFFTRHVWFHIGLCQQYMGQWSSISDVVQFACILPKITRTAFLIVVNAITWSIWKHRNDLCFNNSITHSGRHAILTIISLVVYWIGKLTEDVQVEANAWLLANVDVVPLQVALPEDEQMATLLIED